jgi:adenylyltransferase/sulfurtransferase
MEKKLNDNLMYSRQIPLITQEGQKKLNNSKVFVVGAGGLGSICLYYLAAAGVGTIGIIDDDVVNIHNLNRQIIHNRGYIGKSKAYSAKNKLSRK